MTPLFRSRFVSRTLISVACVACTFTGVAQCEEGGAVRTILADSAYLEIAKQLYQQGDKATISAVNTAISNANAKLTAGPYSVVFSPQVAPSGDIHDYVSYGAYFWPNPDTPDGLPWISRDGFVNPDNSADGRGLCDVRRATEPLSLAYYFTGDEKYATKAASLLRTWFLDAETYMNPKNEYAQIVPGVRPGSFDVPGFGNCMPQIFDAAGILESSPAWSATDKAGLQTWVSDLMQWAETSNSGKIQFREPSNHGTNYDFLKAYFGAYAGDLENTLESLTYYGTVRMRGQVSAVDGSNPLELPRADNMLYHRYNLGRAWDLAATSRHVEGFDLFEYETEDGKSLRKQLDFLMPYMLGEKVWDKWPGATFKMEPAVYYEMFRKAAIFYQEPLLLDAADSLGNYTSNYINLLYPRQAVEDTGNDLNADGVVSVADIDLMHTRLRTGKLFLRYDMNGDNVLNETDRLIFIEERLNSALGDSNLDGVFTSADIVAVLQQGQYNDGIEGNATWRSGDWNGDGEFSEADFIAALTRGSYQRAANPVHAVPEPTGVLPIVWTVSVFGYYRRRNQNRTTWTAA